MEAITDKITNFLMDIGKKIYPSNPGHGVYILFFLIFFALFLIWYYNLYEKIVYKKIIRRLEVWRAVKRRRV